MLSRFIKTKASEPDDILCADNQIFFIEYYGTINIFINTSIGCQIITLLNIAPVLDFIINFVSMNIFTNKEVYFNSKKIHLYQDIGTKAMWKIIMVFFLWKTAQKRKLSWYL